MNHKKRLNFSRSTFPECANRENDALQKESGKSRHFTVIVHSELKAQTYGANPMTDRKTQQIRTWTRPQLVRLGRIEDVAGSNAGTAEANASGALVRS